MPTHALPFPWNEYLQFQSDVVGPTASPASFGHDDALAALVDDFGIRDRPPDSVNLRSQFENLCSNRAAKYRRRIRLVERFAEHRRSMRRESVRSLLGGRGPLPEDHPAKIATSELLGLVRQCVPEADWQVLWMLAQGYSYGEIAACCGLTVESLKSRVCRIRGRIRESRVGRMVQAALT